MNYLAFLIRKLLDSYRDSIKVVKFYNLKSLNGRLIWFRIFFIKFFYSFPELRNKKKLFYSADCFEESAFIEEKTKAVNLLQDIDRQGYSNLFHIKESYLDSLKNLIFESKNHDLQKIPELLKKNIFKINNETQDDYFTRIKSYGISRITGNIDLNIPNPLNEIIFSKKFLSLAKSYLGHNDITVSASYFISFPNKNLNETDKISNAQYFHWDNDFTKFLKLYIYLSDVDENSGPHVFVPGTHKLKKFKHKLHRPYSDNDIHNSYSEVKSFLGNKGASFFVDSYGLHKGETVKKNNRIMLNIHYGKGKLLYSACDKFIKY
jgi:ectoine hydroxylase-related dioxygenase (phytanoyl-CoA dioxygenase family)